MRSSAPPAARRPQPRPPARSVAAVLILVPVFVALALWAFAWPNANPRPHDLPLGVTGPPQATAPLTERLQAADGAFDVRTYPDEAAARDAIKNREVYGALVPGPDRETVGLLTASAAGPSVALLLEQGVSGQLPQDVRLEVTDVVPSPSSDPRGGALAASVLPLTLAGVLTGALLTLLGLRGRPAVAALAGACALVGLVGAAIGHTWLGIHAGHWWAAAGSLALVSLAVAATVAGLGALIGPPGIGVGAVLMVLFGNSFSAAASAPQLLPEPVGTLGQWLPPGAGASLIRSVSFFDGAGAGQPLPALALWTAAGFSVMLLRDLTPRGAGRGRAA
ncbi:hypothetical protein GCM10009716_24740 [Streptomyces sodiiphilus]|uniref:ABC transporter permease n=1 Tax=Streptomyces sodiiphilus TaxID=226217 RepID=A0ABN2P7R4_9ACTN